MCLRGPRPRRGQRPLHREHPTGMSPVRVHSNCVRRMAQQKKSSLPQVVHRHTHGGITISVSTKLVRRCYSTSVIAPPLSVLKRQQNIHTTCNCTVHCTFQRPNHHSSNRSDSYVISCLFLYHLCCSMPSTSFSSLSIFCLQIFSNS